ncbi:MAG: YcxB family protein [Paludibacter sp.]|nr:YcxB family protein [Paludibacter sp.]
MRIEYVLDKEDFLQSQLFLASQSKQVTTSRRKSRLRVPVLYLILAFALFVIDENSVASVFIAIGGLWYIFSPVLYRKRYIRFVEKYIDEHFVNRLGKPESISIGDEYIEILDYQGETKVKVTEITEVTEVRDYYFLKMSSGSCIFIPAYKLPTQRKELGEVIVDLVETAGVKQTVNLDWKWR